MKYLSQTDSIKPPGMQNIKWIELCDKSRPLVPEEELIAGFEFLLEERSLRGVPCQGQDTQEGIQEAASRTLGNQQLANFFLKLIVSIYILHVWHLKCVLSAVI